MQNATCVAGNVKSPSQLLEPVEYFLGADPLHQLLSVGHLPLTWVEGMVYLVQLSKTDDRIGVPTIITARSNDEFFYWALPPDTASQEGVQRRFHRMRKVTES